MGEFGKEAVAILTAIIGVAILAVLLSSKSNTVAVLGAASSGFGNILATAMSPITGNATSGGFGGFTGGGSSSPLSVLGGGGGSPLSMLSGFGGGGIGNITSLLG